MVTGDRLVISMNAELDHHLADEMRDVIDTIIEERGVRHLILFFKNQFYGQFGNRADYGAV